MLGLRNSCEDSEAFSCPHSSLPPGALRSGRSAGDEPPRHCGRQAGTLFTAGSTGLRASPSLPGMGARVTAMPVNCTVRSLLQACTSPTLAQEWAPAPDSGSVTCGSPTETSDTEMPRPSVLSACLEPAGRGPSQPPTATSGEGWHLQLDRRAGACCSLWELPGKRSPSVEPAPPQVRSQLWAGRAGLTQPGPGTAASQGSTTSPGAGMKQPHSREDAGSPWPTCPAWPWAPRRKRSRCGPS